MRNLIIFSMLAVMSVINFTGCGKAQERPTKMGKTLAASEVVDMKTLADITSTEDQNSAENIAFKKQLIAKIEDSEKCDKATLLLEQNRLVYMMMEGKIVLLEFIPATVNKHAVATVSSTVTTSSTAASSSTDAVTEALQSDDVVKVAELHTYESLMAVKEGRTDKVAALKVSTWSQNHFIILTEIGIQTGVLENERTDYNEKKSTLGLTETTLSEAKILILKSEIKETTASTDDASDAATK